MKKTHRDEGDRDGVPRGRQRRQHFRRRRRHRRQPPPRGLVLPPGLDLPAVVHRLPLRCRCRCLHHLRQQGCQGVSGLM